MAAAAKPSDKPKKRALFTGSRLTIRPPADYLLWRDLCSYGYFLLAPNHWHPSTETFVTATDLDAGPVAFAVTQAITQEGQSGSELRVRCDRTLNRDEQAEVKGRLGRILRLDEDAAATRAFHAVDPRWKKTGHGRLMRSESLFQDVVRTVTSCNVAWPNTTNMNRQLCEVLGRRSPAGIFAFPSAKKMARTRAGTLRGRCRVGYRDQRLIDLAGLFVRGEIDEAWLADPKSSDDEVFKFLKTLPGIGPYAAANIMQLLGRYGRLAVDTETVRHGRAVLGLTGEDREVLRELEAHYEQFGDHRFRSYWLELWTFYESKRGRAHTWDRDTTGKSFTAAQLGA